MRVNREGLTWKEWHRAAVHACHHSQVKTSEKTLRAAYRNGEDPTEWCAHFQRNLVLFTKELA